MIPVPSSATRVFISMISLLWPIAGVLADGEAKTSVQAEFESLSREYRQTQQKALQEIMPKLREVKDAAERNRILADYQKVVQPFPRRFLEIAEKNPQDNVAFTALGWITQNSPTGTEFEKAMEILGRDHLNNEKIGTLCTNLISTPSPQAERFLRTVNEQSPHRSAQGLASFTLGRRFKQLAASAKSEEQKKRLVAEAEGFFTRVQQTFADVAYYRLTLGKAADGDLFEMRRLAIGMAVPEIEGEDIDGKPLKLSEYRGKVAVLSYWATWCGPCMALVPHERELVERYRERPFVLLGINGDTDREKVKKTIVEKRISWRSWWQGGDTFGPIASQWNVYTWPTLYVIDAKGVIRHKDIGGQVLEKAIEALLKEVEGDNAATNG